MYYSMLLSNLEIIGNLYSSQHLPYKFGVTGLTGGCRAPVSVQTVRRTIAMLLYTRKQTR